MPNDKVIVKDTFEDDDEAAKIAEAKSKNIVCIVRGRLDKIFQRYAILKFIVFLLPQLPIVGVIVYGFYVRFGDEGSIRLVVVIAVGVLVAVTMVFLKRCGNVIETVSKFTQTSNWKKGITITRWCMYVAVSIFMVVYVIVDVAIKYPENLFSVAGIVFFVLVLYVTSRNPESVDWHVVFWGISMQFILAVVIMRTTWGYDVFSYIGDRLIEFLSHADAGAAYYFGENFRVHFRVFSVTARIIFFSAFVSVFHYMGAMRIIINAIGRFVTFCTGASPAESLCAVTNIFFGLELSPLIIRDKIKDLTNSELHAIMVGGFATIAGSVIGVYVGLGISAHHVIAASVMSAPAALALAKLSFPETKKAKAKATSDIYNMPPSTDRNPLQAAYSGAIAAIRPVVGIGINLIAVLSMLDFMRATMIWLGDRADMSIAFEMAASILLYPMTFLMGVPAQDCTQIAMLLGVKIFVNEFTAYERLSGLMENRKQLQNYTEFFNTTVVEMSGANMTLPMTNETLFGGVLQDRSVVIATYAFCGFANIGSIAITIGLLGGIAPNRINDLFQMILRAFIVGNAASFLTAATAGLLYKGAITN